MLDYNYFYDIIQCIGCLAQLVEQVTFNHWVTGSSPVTPTIQKRYLGTIPKRLKDGRKWAIFLFL